MGFRFPYSILFFHLLLFMFGHYSNGVRDVPKQENFHGNTNEAMKNTSVQLYYKILDELFKRPAILVATASKFGKEFDNFVLDFVQASYIGLFTPDDVYFGKIMLFTFHKPKSLLIINRRNVKSLLLKLRPKSALEIWNQCLIMFIESSVQTASSRLSKRSTPRYQLHYYKTILCWKILRRLRVLEL
ncbi:uncharacterized protein LOC122724107 [Manihot esculenta]|uniref:Uncharacterized protein n=1 Tax=Manihot esculenta TaxID=3983 RepID=A0ACB7HEJ7_MANES|nr:uncharacterized protein LOC122724107 [Manihot esculenta]KAG8650601.1 hypothetical protein MANES_07G053110v8 [Manihot esculenta]